jgi:hypothetical protein
MFLARLCVVAFATAAIGWTVVVLPTLWSESAFAQVTIDVISREAHKPGDLGVLAAALDERRSASSRASDIRKAAVIRLRLAEDAIGGRDRQNIDSRLDSLAQAVDVSIANAPADAYLWLVRFWLENTRNGFQPEHLRYLRLSYALAPNEAWIAVKRNRLALAIYPALPADIAEAATSEFAGLVRSGLYSDAADIFSGPAWPISDVLTRRLQDLNETDRRAFAQELNKRNPAAVSLLGIDPTPQHSWQ